MKILFAITINASAVPALIRAVKAETGGENEDKTV